MRKVQLQDVNWKQSYPRKIEGEDLRLEQRTWGRRLIYEVFQKGTEESLGTCQVFLKNGEASHKHANRGSECKCQNFVVREQVGTPKLIARLEKIQNLVCSNL